MVAMRLQEYLRRCSYCVTPSGPGRGYPRPGMGPVAADDHDGPTGSERGGDHALEHRHTANFDERLVAAHAPAFAAGHNGYGDCFGVHCGFSQTIRSSFMRIIPEVFRWNAQ